MASLGGSLDMGFGVNAAAVFGNIEMDGDEYVACRLCGHSGCDVRVSCGCTAHARCVQLNPNGPLTACPFCSKPVQDLVLFPMSFREIDEAHRTAMVLPNKGQPRSRKRKTIDEEKVYVSERRTGRWTNEEMTYCDKLMAKFATGELPVTDGMKLNEFLGNMLKSKQSRLTKKMKNAKLSSKSFQRSTGCLSPHEARELSEIEESFFQAITDLQERAEIRFHMQKEWREQFSRVCVAVNQPLDADSWLGSVEEMDRRASQTRDAARMARRKLMMGVALRTDSQNPDSGVFIEKTPSDAHVSQLNADKDIEEELLNMMNDPGKNPGPSVEFNGKSGLLHSAPFLSKVTSYLQRHNVPFEHVDVWVPSFVPGNEGDTTSCRLCFAGSSTTEKVVGEDAKTARNLSSDEQFNLFAFGDYSQKFSFDVGCGLPGRVYESGRPTWEQSVHNAPDNHFERCGGALQWGIRTVVGLPIASPNVGRIVVTLYSCFDRSKDEDLVGRLSEEFTRLLPSPKWKLVVDIGEGEEAVSVPASSGAVGIASGGNGNTLDGDIGKDPVDMTIAASVSTHNGTEHNGAVAFPDTADSGRDGRIDEIVALLGEFMPSDPSSPMSPYIQGFMTLRLLLLRQARTPEEEEITRTMLDSFSSYTSGGRNRGDIAIMLARDCMFMTQSSNQQPQLLQQQQAPPALNIGDAASSAAANMANAPPQAPPAAATNPAGLSLFGLPSTSLSLQNSPALTPIQVPGLHDSMSIVSN